MVQRNGAWALAAVVTWGGETQGRDCGEGLPDVSERVDAHTALLSATGTVAPWAERRVRVRRSGAVRRCVIGRWHPGGRALHRALVARAGRVPEGRRKDAARDVRPRRLLGDRPHARRLGDRGLLQPEAVSRA